MVVVVTDIVVCVLEKVVGVVVDVSIPRVDCVLVKVNAVVDTVTLEAVVVADFVCSAVN